MPVTIFLRVKPSSHLNLKEILYLEDDQVIRKLHTVHFPVYDPHFIYSVITQTVRIDTHQLKTIVPVNHQILAMNYKFNKIFYHNSQEEIYQITASHLINDALIGINGTILCYGQIGAGKTYTMSGLSQIYNDRGIIPRSIGHLFEEIQKRSTLSITVKLSYIEIYNEQIIDLLAGISLDKTTFKRSSFEFLQIAESNDQVYIKGLNCLTVNNLEEALTVLFEQIINDSSITVMRTFFVDIIISEYFHLKCSVRTTNKVIYLFIFHIPLFVQGELNRTVASHSLNRFSSRAHAIFTVYLTIIDSMDSNGCIKCSKIHYVDLAGSDNLKRTQTTDKLFKESAYINRSLAFLEQTILALSDPTRDYIPYRQSKLTHFLKNSIGGRCQTILIANIWNKNTFLKETLSTLRFASRAMSIPSKPEINQMHDSMAIIKKLQNSNANLLRELLMYDTLNNRGQINYDSLTEKQKNKLRNSVLKYLNNEVKDLEIVNLQQLKETFNIFKQITKSLQVQLDETKGQLSRQSDYTGSRSPTTVAVSTISSSSRSGGTVQGSKIASSNSNISTTKRQTNNLVNNETNLGKSVQNVNFKDKSLIFNQVGELDASSGRGFLPPIDRNVYDKFSLMTDGAVLQ
ncbi:kinesin family member 6/9, partial [Schistosoma bovis]